MIHPISTPILNHKCSKVFNSQQIHQLQHQQYQQQQQQENKKKENPNNKKVNDENNNNNSNNNENKENKEDNCIKKNKTEVTDKKKNDNNSRKQSQEDWTSGEQLQKQLKYQYDHYIDLECIFGVIKMCKLDTIFPNCQETIRGSSGDWRNDGLTKEEREEYRREVELEKLL